VRRAIVVTSEGAREGMPRLVELAGPEIDVIERFELGETEDADLLAAGIADAWAVVAGSERYGTEVFEAAPGLRAIVRFGAGYDAIDLAAATDRGVAICVTPGANAEAVADMTLALMLACLRQVPALAASVRRGHWRPPALARDLAGSTVAIVGLGAIGSAVARRLHGFGCTLLGVDPHPSEESLRLGVAMVELDDALGRADVITLHAPLGGRPLLGRRELSLLPSHAVVVNTARGGLIDETALVDALHEGAIGGAGLDVFAQEPLTADHPLVALDQVVLTPHASAFTQLAVRQTADAVADALRALLGGRVPSGCLNPAAWRDALSQA
jgi:phosphoglycerate dehydrogenase-like enzyme